MLKYPTTQTFETMLRKLLLTATIGLFVNSTFGQPESFHKLNDIDLATKLGETGLVGMSNMDRFNLDTLSEFGRTSLLLRAAHDSVAIAPRTMTIHGLEYYLVEGDMSLTKSEYFSYLMWKLEERNNVVPDSDRGKLQGISDNGRIVRWPVGHVLKYAVIRASFPTDAKYRAVVDNMKAATSDWSSTCGVQFEHIANLDEVPAIQPSGDLSFIVAEYDARGEFIARAFFPNSPIHRRQVLVDPSYYNSGYDGVGVLRHELGHVLGFYHEHTRAGAPSVCPGETPGDAIDLTAYDPRSVMHYFCGGVGSKELKISDWDRIGSQKVYGDPLPK